jgi:hypothetical protein
MPRILRSHTLISPIAILLVPTSAWAQLTISTETTTPVRTSTATSAGAGDISLTEDGEIEVSSGAAITIDSNNKVTNDEGTITVGGANGASGIDVLGGLSASIDNSGSITVSEDFVADNADGNTIVDGPIAKASDRAGIRVRGPLTGTIDHSGSINVEGLNSAGIRVDGTLTGSLRSSGSITVIGDYSVGIRTADVNGDIAIDGAINVVGEGMRALDITGDVSGTIRIQDTVAQGLSYTDDDGSTMTLSRSDLRVGAPAVAIVGNVAGGIIVAVPPTTSTSDTDIDDDGVADIDEGTGAIQSYGNGAALLIGGSEDIVIGAVSGDGHSIVIDGTVNSTAYYSNTDTAALVIGGQGGAVSLPGGISVDGVVKATTNDAMATGLLIDNGSTVPVLDISGTVSAVISSQGEGAAYTIQDLSGTLTTINTNGYITATGSSEDTVVAIDLRANTSGVTINQYTAPDEDDEDDEALIRTQITGAILTGSGNDLLDVSDGQVIGNTSFGAGDDRVILSGDSIYQGKLDFGTGAGSLTMSGMSTFVGTTAFNNQGGTITLAGDALYAGNITGGSQLHVAVNGGTLFANDEDMNFATLTVGAGGTLKVAIDGETSTNPQFNVNSATFETGAHIAATVSSLSTAQGSYVVVAADTINGTPTFSEEETELPFLFKGSVTVDQNAGEVVLDIARKTATELRLNRNQAAAYEPIIAAAPLDSSVESSLLEVEDAEALAAQFDGLLPDHAGGNFDLLTRGSRLASRHLTNNNTLFDISGMGGWFEAIKWRGSKNETGSASYMSNGWGLSGGIESKTGFGSVGLSFAWLNGTNDNRANDNEVKANAYEFGAFWRLNSGPVYAFARAGVSLASFDSSRTFTGTISDTDFTRTATADWKGQLYSGMAGISYQVDFGDYVSFRPMAIVDYYRLHEGAYTETGGGDAMNLIVAPRDSDALTVTTTMTAIYRFGRRNADGIPFTIELDAGRRNRAGGTLGDTVAHFLDGEDFRLTADKLKSAWLAEARVLSGGLDYTWTISGGVEQTEGAPAYSARISLGVAF